MLEGKINNYNYYHHHCIFKFTLMQVIRWKLLRRVVLKVTFKGDLN